MTMLERAIEIAQQKHEGQFRRGGEPYITHPLAVMHMLQLAGFPQHFQEVAVLHDIIEDTDCTEDDLLSAGFDENKVVKVVKILSKEPDESYDEYEQEVLESYTASQVKARDVMHNLSSNPKPEKVPIYESLLARIAMRWGLEYLPENEAA